jgi:hypothetical protein
VCDGDADLPASGLTEDDAPETGAPQGDVRRAIRCRIVSLRLGRAFRAVLLAAWALSTAAPRAAEGAPPLRTDVVVIANGDRITCEIKRLDLGQLEVKTDDIGTVDIKWDKVVHVSSVRQFEVETVDGRRFIGSLRSTTPRQIEVVEAAGTVALALPDIVSIRTLGRGWLRGLEGWLDIGFSYSRGSGVAQLTSDFSASRKRPSYETTLAASGVLTRQPDQEDSSRLTLSYRYWRVRGERWLFGAIAAADRNTDLGIELRGSTGGGVGYRVVKTNRNVFVASAAVLVNRELPTNGETTTNVESVLGLTYSLFMRNYPKTYVDVSSQLVPSLSDTGRVRYVLDASVRREVWRDFTVGISLYDNYDNRPPSQNKLQNDVGLALSIGWVF